MGAFLLDVAPPLGIATIQLDDGASVKGFVCEAHAVAQATDITRFGGWRAYLKSLA
jgi:allophanate hydrolase